MGVWLGVVGSVDGGANSSWRKWERGERDAEHVPPACGVFQIIGLSFLVVLLYFYIYINSHRAKNNLVQNAAAWFPKKN